MKLTYSLGTGWLVFDIIFGLVGVKVDGITGSWFGFDETSFTVKLEQRR